ncbi:MAG: DinB family protein [Cytophagaceae bacterium]|nr:MAG: DinB family protein [Cytophagaceae bacterium]
MDTISLQPRINALTPTSKRVWGTMTVGQMLAHCTDQVRIVLNEKSAKNTGTAVTRWLTKWFVMLVPLPLPRNIKTFPELDPSLSFMTKPGDFDVDRANLLAALSRLSNAPENHRTAHPIFGTMSKSEAIKLTQIHLDHHLRQFSA